MTFKPTSGLTSEGLRRSITAKRLSTADRKSLPKATYVFPDKAPGPGSYPIPDPEHGRKALQLSGGKPEEGTVRRAVCSKFPNLPACKKD